MTALATTDATPDELRQEVESLIAKKGFDDAVVFAVKDVLDIDNPVRIETDATVTRISFQSKAFSIEIKVFLNQEPMIYTVKHLRNGVSYPCPVVIYNGNSPVDALYEGLLEAYINGLFW